MAENPYLSFDQVRAAMNAMTEKALELPNEPVAMAIVDDTGNMVAYAKMDNLRMFSRRHAIRKALYVGHDGPGLRGPRGQRPGRGQNSCGHGRPDVDPKPGRSRHQEGRGHFGRYRCRGLPQRPTR